MIKPLKNYRLKADDNQRKAICHFTGPALVIAGPGSGKTKVITGRISNLIHFRSVKPENILVLTFSKAAAQEMKSRLLKQERLRNTSVTFGTFHAVFLYFLKINNRNHLPKILTLKDNLSIIRKTLDKLGKEIISEEFLMELLSDIQRAKSKNLELKFYESKHLPANEFRIIVKEYEKMKKLAGYMDFDDILIKTLDLLSRNPKLQKDLQLKFHYILIDEFQDINPIQYEIVKKLSGGSANIFAVGDEDQSIYSFRGSTPDIMRIIREDYPDLTLYYLQNNYRSVKEIVELGNRLIAHNKNRNEKKVVSANATSKGEVRLWKTELDTEEYEKICRTILDLPKEEWWDTVILTRKNEISIRLLRLFKKYKIPFSIEKESINIYESDVAKDLYAYLSLTSSMVERENFVRVLNKPMRYLNSHFVPEGYFRLNDLYLKADDYERKTVTELIRQIEFMRDLDPFAAIQYLRKSVGYEEYLKRKAENIQKTKNAAFDDLECLNIIQEESKEYDNISEWLGDFSSKNATISGKSEGIRIMTMHHSKGLEFLNVLIPDLKEGNIPICQENTLEETEEERRLFYVAVTRAKKRLFLFTVKQKETERIIPSRFLKEMSL